MEKHSCGEKLGDIWDDIVWICLVLVEVDDFSVAIDEELSEIPFDAVSVLITFESLVDWMS